MHGRVQTELFGGRLYRGPTGREILCFFWGKRLGIWGAFRAGGAWQDQSGAFCLLQGVETFNRAEVAAVVLAWHLAPQATIYVDSAFTLGLFMWILSCALEQALLRRRSDIATALWNKVIAAGLTSDQLR